MGPWKSIPITKGDQIALEVHGKYNVSTSQNSSTSLTAFLQANPGYSNTTGADGQTITPPFSLSNLSLGISINPSVGNPNNTGTPNVPNAYLKYIIYDQNKNYVEDGIVYLSTVARNTWEKISIPSFSLETNGYIEIFVANESNITVWFDDLKITHTPSLIAQENHYDPWGLNLTGLEKNGSPNHRYQYNKMSEKEENFGLNWYETRYRSLDIQLGRWHQVDPMAEEDEDGVNLRSLSPYNAMGNDPIRYNDPDGDCPLCPFFIAFFVGAISDAAVQTTSNMVQGQNFTQAVNNVDPYSVGISGTFGVIGGTIPKTIGAWGKFGLETTFNVAESFTKQGVAGDTPTWEQTGSDALFAFGAGKLKSDPINTDKLASTVKSAEKTVAKNEGRVSTTRINSDKNDLTTAKNKLQNGENINNAAKVYNKTSENAGQEVSNKTRAMKATNNITRLNLIRNDNLNNSRSYKKNYDYLKK